MYAGRRWYTHVRVHIDPAQGSDKPPHADLLPFEMVPQPNMQIWPCSLYIPANCSFKQMPLFRTSIFRGENFHRFITVLRGETCSDDQIIKILISPAFSFFPSYSLPDELRDRTDLIWR